LLKLNAIVGRLEALDGGKAVLINIILLCRRRRVAVEVSLAWTAVLPDWAAYCQMGYFGRSNGGKNK